MNQIIGLFVVRIWLFAHVMSLSLDMIHESGKLVFFSVAFVREFFFPVFYLTINHSSLWFYRVSELEAWLHCIVVYAVDSIVHLFG